MADRAIWLDEMSRQGKRLEADLVVRQVGIALSCVLFGVLLPFWLVFFTYLLCVGCDILQLRLQAAFAANPTRFRHALILANSTAIVAFYCVPALFLAMIPGPLVKFAALLPLVGALLNVSIVRSIHLPMGILSSVPPALVLLWIPAQSLGDPTAAHVGLAIAGGVALVGYFIASLVQNHRAQTALIIAIEDANAANRAKSRFLSAMSHELRTPLNGVLGHSQLLREAGDLDTARRHAAEVEAAARILRMLAEDVIDLASLSEGEIRFHPVTAAIRAELEAVASMKLPVKGGKDPVMSIEIAPEVPEFGRFDPILLRKCLTHLSAAVMSDHSSDSPARIDMRCSLAPGRMDRLRITIAARGPGCAPEDRVAIPGGEGLATTLVHRIAEVMGARAAVLRAPDGSPVARIEVPFVMVPDPPETGAESIYGRLRVLVVDDIATNRLIVVQMLRSLRIEAFEAESGGDALDRLADEEFDLVLLDMNMPDMDGEATFREIRTAGTGWAGIPVVALTADAAVTQREHYMALDLDGFISKPVDKRLLWAEILSAVPPPPPL
ncbi:response regulator [Defluviimonas salinarum]|uniref:histidine kinase n=1 Tax=Defluviimonas salinarum TaxID=2992147 RepID=A0ABT3J981_9RHOB|nr:response regulator [Defluviimonas salinarum]MCW3784248.1 response regulator [Defluviimonas salinarum]